jgi:uncharacterized iron-regulated membrane protein
MKSEHPLYFRSLIKTITNFLLQRMTKQTTPWYRIRKLFQTIHLWLGLASGIIVVAICFSGTVYVFNTELTEMSAPELYKVKPAEGGQRMPVENMLAGISEHLGKVNSAYIPSNAYRTYRFDVKKEGDKSRSGTSYFVNPYTGDIVGTSLQKNKTKEFMSTMFSLHRWLLLDKIETPIFKNITNRELGSMITGWATIIFTLGCITGMVIWFPRKIRNWRQGLKIKTNGNWKRIIHDLHNAPAFYALIFLLLMGLTGPQWSFEWYRDGMQKTLGTYQPKEKTENKKSLAGKKNDQPIEVSSPINLTALLANADQQLRYKGDYTIRFPEDAKSPISITKNKNGFFAPSAGDKITANASNGEILKTELFKNKPFNERVAGSIKALHTGSIYGMFTKLLYFFACLIATILPVTGTIIWINKLKKKKKRNATPTPGRSRSSISVDDGSVLVS